MNRFVGRLIVFAGLCLGVVELLSRTVPPNEVEMSFLRGLTQKHDLLDGPREPSLILLGGSGTAFGFDSERIADDCKQPVINAGLHAGLGIRFMIEDVEPRLIAGDHLVLSLEYELWTQTTVGSAALAAVFTDIDPHAAKRLTIWEQLRMSDDWLTYVGRKTAALARDESNRLLGRNVVHSGAEIYRGDGFNQRGDLTTHWNRKPIAFPAMSAIGPDEVQKPLMLWVRDRMKDMEKRGIRCTLMPPVLEEESYRNQAPLIEAISAELSAAGIPYASPPENHRYEREFFFDTPYHLNRDGISKRCEQFLRDFCRLIATADSS